uniref:Gypsy retrotransposon integrase-like protein 1 n=1 Tax=Gasterosteus aculeatus aculeatus TaxID=481459 RepID=A0AAQ4RV13_GASAC
MDPGKVRAVLDWPQPVTRLQLQRFLGFANFYRRFIRDYSRVAAQLTALTSSARPFCWSPEADRAFRDLKHRFTTAPILTQPDPKRQFVVEVDASEVGVGAILSQRSSADGSRNGKADALSRVFARTEETRARTETILPRSLVVGAVVWRIEEEVKTALRSQPGPGNGPPGRLFVPEPLRSAVLQWAHASRIACHPGVARTMALLRRRFWWPAMGKDTQGFVAACPVCARNKGTNRPSAGLLHPLPIPRRPWSHLALDFVTGLPLSEGNTVVLTVVDRFSKFAHFVPLPKLPSATQTAAILVKEVFRIHGLPRDIVSDRGPQFTSAVWKAFCTAIGATASLSSGFHPQSNGQAERANQKMEATLRCLVSSNPTTWSSRLPWAEYAHNTLPTAATGMSPFQCLYGYQPPLFPSQEKEIAVPSV